MAVIALIFDFDDTLLPDTTSALLESRGIDPGAFWSDRASRLVDSGYDPPLAYLNLLLDETKEGNPLHGITNQDLRDFGRTLDDTWFPGLPAMFDDLRELVANQRNVSIEFYVISGGLEAVIGGSEIVNRYFTGYYGCQFGEDPDTAVINRVKRCVTFTEKTRFLFEINKGIPMAVSRTQPHMVNRQMEASQRPIPFGNMVYVGDGLTDIPCFSLIMKNGGQPYGVFQPGAESAKQTFQELLRTDRVMSLHAPDYRQEAELGAILRLAVQTLAQRISLEPDWASSRDR